MAPGAVLAPFTYVQIVLAGIHVLRGQVGSERTGAWQPHLRPCARSGARAVGSGRRRVSREESPGWPAQGDASQLWEIAQFAAGGAASLASCARSDRLLRPIWLMPA